MESLRGYGTRETIPGEVYNELVNLAAQICETPIALMSLVEEHEQWFAAKTGVSISSTPLSESVCSHAILDEGLCEIPDTLDDPRTFANRLCHDETEMRFYAGVPLITATGMPLGTLCVIDTKPRELNSLQRKTLEVLARQVMAQMELRKSLYLADVLRREMDHRVKNSLTMVASLVRLYRRTASTGEASVTAFDAIERRVSAIASLHRELHSTSQEERVPFQRFLERVVAHLREECQAGVYLTVDSDEGMVESGQAAAVGSVVSEFVANSLKHGFPEGRGGIVHVMARLDEHGLRRLVCMDNGVGCDGRREQQTDAEALGEQLMEAAAEQSNLHLEKSLTSSGCYLQLTRREHATPAQTVEIA
ncbi:histidine kinase dimerization/phosphoacceptor domain -containing protein [Litoreibacter ponti]|uniref:histidine kinase dimerization/phosphoacceptor domain -containing protein n=1 Tax=Litoreibacter ponti TaxID=1510457 RepID=UPI001304CCF2|nr:histidine kinase dimerization/phosphoacceptor domain -containing protein [Litoreibacter ponti]